MFYSQGGDFAAVIKVLRQLTLIKKKVILGGPDLIRQALEFAADTKARLKEANFCIEEGAKMAENCGQLLVVEDLTPVTARTYISSNNQ